MIATLFLFHLRVGVRVALRASPPLFCGIVAAVMLQDPPGAAIVAIARETFSPRWTLAAVLPVVGIAVLLPAWARGRISQGLNGWIRHLPISDASQRRGVLLALLTVQLPLLITIGLLAVTAKSIGLPIAVGSLRWVLVTAAGAMASLPASRRLFVVSLSVAAAALSLHGTGEYSIFSLLFLVAADALAGPLHYPQRAPRLRSSGMLLNWQISWRAVSFRIIPSVLSGAIMIGASWLFIANNDLQGTAATAAARLGGTVGCAFCLSSIARALGTRRPSWPLSRSFPWSATRRIIDDGLFAAIWTLPLLLLVALRDIAAAFMVLTVVPVMSIRAAEFIRRVPERRVAPLALLGEGIVIGIMLTLLPWTALLWPAAALVALYSAREFERNRKSTLWFELHHAAAGDSASWSE